VLKKVIGVIVALAVIWAIPEARAKVLTVMQPVADRTGPIGEKASLPMRKYAAKTQIASILRGMTRAREKGEELPTQRTFVRWLRANPPSEKKELDPWGHSYYIKQQNDTYTVGSFGPDGIKGTIDDIVKSTRL
jgi:hypothetical protein